MINFESLHLHAPSNNHAINEYSSKSPEMTDTGDIMRYIYQHAFYEEMPEMPQNNNHDHNAIYNYETNYIGHGIYEDVSKTMQLFNEIEKSQSDVFMDIHPQNIVNIGCPQNNNDVDSLIEAYKEMYNAEQNEILQMNIESTIQRQKNLQKVDCQEHAIENKDMSADPVLIPVYKPIPYAEHKAMFATMQLQEKDQTYKNIWPKEIEDVEKYKLQDGETFLYEHNDDMVEEKLTPMVEAVCLSADQADKVIFNDNTYAKITYDEKGHLIALYESAGSAAPLEIPVVIDNGASVNVTPKWYYDQNKFLYILPKQKSYLPQINTGYGPIDHHFWIDIPIKVQGVFLQVKSLVCGTQAPYGLLLSRHALDQMQHIQVYDKQKVWLKQTTIPLMVTTNTTIPPQKAQAVTLKLDMTSQKAHIEGRSVSWIVTRYRISTSTGSN